MFHLYWGRALPISPIIQSPKIISPTSPLAKVFSTAAVVDPLIVLDIGMSPSRYSCWNQAIASTPSVLLIAGVLPSSSRSLPPCMYRKGSHR